MRYLAILIILNLFWTVPIVKAQDKSLYFTTADNQNRSRSKAMNELVTICFARMGIPVKIIPMPSERSLFNANTGTQDGCFLRVAGVSKTYPNLIMVPEPFYVTTIVAFSKNKYIKIDGWKSLLPYRAAWVKGWQICDRELRHAKQTTRLKDEKTLFLFLEKGRADLGVFGLHTGSAMLKQLGITDIYPLSPPISISNLYIYVHKKHAALIPQLVKTIQEMKNDGTFQRTTDKYNSTAPIL